MKKSIIALLTSSLAICSTIIIKASTNSGDKNEANKENSYLIEPYFSNYIGSKSFEEVLLGKSEIEVTIEEEIVENGQEELETEETPVEEYHYIVPFPHSIEKRYEHETAITAVNSAQYKLLLQSYTGDYGIKMVDGYYLVAMGTAYADYIGEKIEITFETGEVINVMIGDFKSDAHTDSNRANMLSDGNMLEFIVDPSQMPSEAKLHGSYDCIFTGYIKYLRKL